MESPVLVLEYNDIHLVLSAFRRVLSAGLSHAALGVSQGALGRPLSAFLASCTVLSVTLQAQAWIHGSEPCVQTGHPRFECHGVPDGDVIIGDIRDEVTESEVCCYFGPRASKSGWKYNAVTTLDEQEAILSLYKRVYEVSSIPNKEISLHFARGLILMSLGKKVNWALFRNERRAYRDTVKRKKVENAKLRNIETDQIPANLNTRRCVAPGSDFPTTISLKVKQESLQSVGSMGKVGRAIGKSRENMSPCWMQEDLDMVRGVIERRSTMVEQCRRLLFIASSEKGVIEDKLRRAEILLSDRKLMVTESKSELQKLLGEELAVRADLEERCMLVAPASVQIVDMGELDSIFFKKLCEERTFRLSEKVVLECEASILDFESELITMSSREKELEHKCLRWRVYLYQ